MLSMDSFFHSNAANWNVNMTSAKVGRALSEIRITVIIWLHSKPQNVGCFFQRLTSTMHWHLLRRVLAVQQLITASLDISRNSIM